MIDRTYEALEAIARGTAPSASGPADGPATGEPERLHAPPADLELHALDAASVARLRGREVWLVHPWALRAPPAGVPPDTEIIGVYLQEHHAAWPWPQARWRWVDAAMAQVAPKRCFMPARDLAAALAGARCVRSVADPHVSRWLAPLAHLDPAPALFPAVDRRCGSFSQWWARATRGLGEAQELM